MAVTISGSTGVAGAPLQRGTEVATTSGTTITIATNIPDWVSRITVIFYGVSTNSTSRPMLQFGTGSTPTYVTTGYAVSSDNYATSAGPISTVTGGFVCGSTSSAASLWNVTYTFISTGSNRWVGVVGGSTSGGAGVVLGGGTITLGAPLTAIRLTTPSGTDVFDAGAINYIYE
jgi:hypothetical protein